MKKELNKLTEEQARKIVDLVAGREFKSFSCDEAVLKSDGFFRVRIEMDNNYVLFIFSSGNIFLIDKKGSLQPLNTLYIIDYLRFQGFYSENKFEQKNDSRIEFIKNYFNNISEEKLTEFKGIIEKYAGVGPNVPDFIKDQEEFFNMVTKEELQQSAEEIDKMELGGPSVEEYFSKFPKKFLELIKSGKIEKTEEMAFSREGFIGGYKLIDHPNLNFNLIEVVEATKHPLKKVEEGIRVYRIEWGTGTFTIIHEDTSSDQIEVGTGDTILIKAGDSYRYKKGLGNKLDLFEINIKYP